MGRIWNMVAGAGEGNRTLVISLEGFCSTIELHPPAVTSKKSLHPEKNPRRRPGGGGWIRTNVGARPTDLQSAPFSRSGTPPAEPEIMRIIRRLVKKSRQKSLRSVANRGAERLDCRERAVAGKPGSLGVFRRRHVLEHQGEAPGAPRDADGVGIQLERRVGDHLEARTVRADATERQDGRDVDVLREVRHALARRSFEQRERRLQ